MNHVEAAYKAICNFFHNVTQLFTNIMTASGRNNHNGRHGHYSMMQHQRLEMGHDFSDDEEREFDEGRGGLAAQLLTPEQ